MLKGKSPLVRRGLARLLAGVLIGAGYACGAHAETGANATYVISDQEGYGLLECLTRHSDCGKVVADSWCESHGHVAAKAFGRADDMTASVEKGAARASFEAGAAIVACME
jgi:hypothetical protein